jgi:ATP-dependent DNA helicase RecG
MSKGKQLMLFDDLSLYEGTDIEYKSGKGGLPSSLWETYSAFANTEGGTIFLGVAQRGAELDVHGLENPDKLKSDLFSALNNRTKVSRNLLGNDDVEALEVAPSRHVLRIVVPRADRRQRPVYVGLDPFRGTYRRNHEGDYLCTEDEVRRMFADQRDEPVDSLPMLGFSMADLDQDSIQQFRNRFASRAPNHPWLSERDEILLTKLGALWLDRDSGKVHVTLAGMVMFGNSDTIQLPQAVPSFQLDYRERLSDDPSVRWTDRITIDGTWPGNLFQFYLRVMRKLALDPGLKAPFIRDREGVRRSGSAVHEALQEALVNALIHADHTGQGGIVIDRYPDRFEFSNPGTLLVSHEQLMRGSVSECRNKSLQRMFQMLGVGDKAGSGIDKIRKSWDAQHWRSPSLKDSFRPDRVQLVLPMVSMLPESVLKALRERFGNKLAALGKEEMQALATAATEGSVTNLRLQEILKLHRADITGLLKGLVQDKLLVAKGVRRGAWYELVGGPLSLEPSPASLLPGRGNKSKRPANEAEIPGGNKSVRRGNKLGDKSQADPVREAILEACRETYLTIKEIAKAIGRSPGKLRRDHIYPMVSEGLLVPKFKSPKHPKQAYTTAKP